MKSPTIWGIIDRRILVNFRVDADVLARWLPRPFRPKLVRGFGVAGICLIRLKAIRPRWMPAWLGVSSENAAHRIAVEWEQDGVLKQGVYIPRRDTSSRLNAFAGGRLFPGVHHHARFDVTEGGGSYRIEVANAEVQIAVAAKECQSWPAESVFSSVNEASDFFACGSLGYSPSKRGGILDGLELRSDDWHVEPLAVEHIESSFFDDAHRFPPESVQFDCALLMRDVRHEWRGRGTLACGAVESAIPSLAASPAPAPVRSAPARRAWAC